jgi:uncharacterized SAM-binding protein YcdF (DUF218 family)
MFYFISKLLSFLLMPAGITFILLIWSYRIKNHTKSKRMLLMAIFFLYINCNPFLINELMLWWEVPPTSISQMTQHDVGIVLSGGITNDDKLPKENIFLGKSGDRAAQAIQLYKKGKIKKIIMSGGSTNILGTSAKMESVDVAQYMVDCGVNKEDIILDTLSKNTRENAINSAAILKKFFPNQRYVLITSATHLKRSIACFQKVGVRVTPFGSNYYSHERQFIPAYLGIKEEYLYYSETVLHEIFGYLVYWVMGYV